MSHQSPPSGWVSGRCACGGLRYEVRLGKRLAVCHCDTCRQASGAAGMPWACGDRASLVLHGTPGCWRSSTHAQRWFCRDCGGQLFCLEDDEPDKIEVAVGSLVDEQPFEPLTRSYAHRRPAWDADAQGYAHIQLGADDLEALVRFYDRLLPMMGWERRADPAEAGPAGVYWTRPGQRWPQFVVGRPFDGRAASTGNGCQVSFLAPTREVVEALWREALAAGATDEGSPGPRPRYASDFFAAYCRDPQGHKLCFVHTERPEPQAP